MVIFVSSQCVVFIRQKTRCVSISNSLGSVSQCFEVIHLGGTHAEARLYCCSTFGSLPSVF